MRSIRDETFGTPPPQEFANTPVTHARRPRARARSRLAVLNAVRPMRATKQWAAVATMIAILSIGGPAFVPTANAQRPASAAPKAESSRKPTGTLILGELTSLIVNDSASGGQIVVAGNQITIPDRLLIGLPSGLVPLDDLMLEAPAECKSQRPPQSGLAVSDSCRGDRPPALARVIASRNASGELVASLLMIQKESARTLARIKPQGRSRARSYGQK